jgi:hypothetical protein
VSSGTNTLGSHDRACIFPGTRTSEIRRASSRSRRSTKAEPRQINHLDTARDVLDTAKPMNATSAVRVWQLTGGASDEARSHEERPPDFTGTCRQTRSGVLHLEVVSGVPTGDPSAMFVVEGRGAYELLRREGTGSAWGLRKLVLTLRPRGARPQD